MNSKWLFILLFFAGLMVQCSANRDKITFYVSPNGSDNWSGRESKVGKEDGPFLTLTKALAAVADLRAAKAWPTGGVAILLRGGDYAVNSSITLDSTISGTADSPLVIKPFKEEIVRFLGGRMVSGFVPAADPAIFGIPPDLARQQIYQLDLKSLGITDYGQITPRGGPGLELFLNGQRMPLARWPNTGWAEIADVPQSGNLVYAGNLPHKRFGIPVGRHYGRITYEGDRPDRWSNAGEIFLHGYWTWDWFDEYLQVDSIDTLKNEIIIKPPHSRYGYAKKQKFYALNIPQELDSPGEWYLNRKSGILYFWPPEPIESATAVLSLLDEPVFRLRNVEHVILQGLTIESSRNNGVVVDGGEGNLIAGCTFRLLGDVAVRINGGHHNGVQSCDIFDVAAGGISLDGGDRKSLTPGNNFADNNHIHHYSTWIRTYQAAISIGGVGNRISHNLIHDAPHSGIILTGNEHLIEYNEMYNLAQETGDVGAFYMGRDWTQRGNIIRNNYFHDLLGPGLHGVQAVYLDDWTSGTTVVGNIFVRAGRGVMIGGGRDNLVENNLFIDCRPAVHVDSRGLGWAKYYFDGTTNTLFERMDAMNYRQPPYSERYPELLSLYDDDPAVAKNNVITRNVSIGGRWLDLFNDLDLSIVHCSDNLIVNPEKEYVNEQDVILQNGIDPDKLIRDDFQFGNNSQAIKLGYKNIPVSRIGLYKDNYRKSLKKRE